MWFSNKKQNNVSEKEFASSMSTIAMDISMVKGEINDVKRAYIQLSKDNDLTNNSLAGLIEIIKNNSTKKQLEAKNKLSNDESFTTGELYDVIVALIS